MTEQADFTPTPAQPQAPVAGQPVIATPQPSQYPLQPVPAQQVFVQAQQPVYVQARPDKSTGVAYLLWFFFGFLGVHQFYIGKIGRGIGYFLTFGWLTIALWIDLFTLASQVRNVNAQRRVGLR